MGMATGSGWGLEAWSVVTLSLMVPRWDTSACLVISTSVFYSCSGVDEGSLAIAWRLDDTNTF